METILNVWHPVVGALALAALMGAGWAVGAWWARGHPSEDRDETADKYNDLVIALLGLLLAFTFSISLGQHDDRRYAVSDQANKVSDFITCVNLQDDPWRTQLRKQLLTYVETQLELPQPHTDEAELQEILGRIDGLHDAMETQVIGAVKAGSPTFHPLVTTYNDMTSAMMDRLTARRARLPGAVGFVLGIASVASALLLGSRAGRASRNPIAGPVGFVVIVGLVIWVTLDLNRPYAGWVRVSQEPVERLLPGLRR